MPDHDRPPPSDCVSQRLNVFVYGTLRTPSHEDDNWLSIHGFDPAAEQIGERGGWRLDQYAIYGEHERIPAVRRTDDDSHFVIGDVYSVTIEGFARLLRYESWPSLYQYESAAATRIGSGDTLDVVLFTTWSAPSFGRRIVSGDFHPVHSHTGG